MMSQNSTMDGPSPQQQQLLFLLLRENLPSNTQLTGLQLSRTVASIPSILGALYIVQHILRSPKSGVGARIVLGMSLMDVVLSLVNVCSSTIAPKELQPILSWARGSWTTCEVFGFLGQGSSMSSVLYNASLTLYYLLTIRYGWSEPKVTKRLNWWLHGLPLVLGWGMAIVAYVEKLYNPYFIGCTIQEFPVGCSTLEICQRGEDARYYRAAFLLTPVFGVFFVLVVAMALIYHKLSKTSRSTDHLASYNLQQEPSRRELLNLHNTSSSLSSTPSSSLRRVLGAGAALKKQRSRRRCLNRLKQEFAVQALLYGLAYVVTWFFPTIGWWMIQSGKLSPPITILYLSSILSSLQGFWNAFIYIRPRYLRYRRRMQRQQQHQAASREHHSVVLQALVCAISVREEGAEDDEMILIQDEEEENPSPAKRESVSESSTDDV